jgi:hypothetical protein
VIELPVVEIIDFNGEGAIESEDLLGPSDLLFHALTLGLARAPELEIVGAVVLAISIPVVHFLALLEGPPEHRGHHPSVLEDQARSRGVRVAGPVDQTVSLRCDASGTVRTVLS